MKRDLFHMVHQLTLPRNSMKNIFDIYEGILDKDNRQTVGANVEETVKQEIHDYIKKHYLPTKFVILNEKDKDGRYLVNVFNSIYPNDGLESITNGKFVFNKVNESCSFMNAPIKNLDGCPRIVKGCFFVSDCEELESLKGGPDSVGEDYHCNYCISLKSFEGMTQKIGGAIRAAFCTDVESLYGVPKTVKGDFDIHGCCSIKSLYGFPKTVKGDVCASSDNFDYYDIDSVCKVGGEIYMC